MKVIDTSQTVPTDLSEMEREWVYNGMDCCITLEVMNAIRPQLDAHTGPTYDFSRACQGPALEMRLRGILVDKARHAEVIEDYYNTIDRLERQLDTIILEGIGLPQFNWRSNPNLARLFYDELQIPAPRGRRSVDRHALEKLDEYIIARPIVRHLVLMRELAKKIDALKSMLDPDGRMRTSYNIAGTNTGRWSSSFTEFGTGGNQQNIEEALRSMFIADPGTKFGKFDGAQIQSRIVGATEWNIFHDGTYLDACESGDLHTTVAKMTWPDELPWTGDRKKDKDIAETPYYRHYTYRFMCKKLGHGSNFDGEPPTLATQSRIPVLSVIEFQRKYFKAFPCHKRLSEHFDLELRRTGTIIALDGRKRKFWGRRGDSGMVRDALAFNAQSCEAKIVNEGMLEIWRKRDAILVKQDHDAVVVAYPEEREDEVVPKILQQLRYPLRLKHGRELLIPYDAKVGWNLGDYSTENPMGLKDWVGGDKRQREKPVHILDRKAKR